MVDNWGLHLVPLFVVGDEGFVGGGGRNLVHGSKFKIMLGNCLEDWKDKDNKDKKTLFSCLFYFLKIEIYSKIILEIYLFYIFVFVSLSKHVSVISIFILLILNL